MATIKDQEAEKILDNIFSIISEKTGIKFRETHRLGILRYIEKRIEELKISFEEYLQLIKNNDQEILALINASTVNETYFFREENQFELVKKIISPKNKVDVWSAACSSGEEIYSLKLLCDSVKKDSSFFASDINTDKLQILKNGTYNKKQTTREIDGKAFHNLLTPYLSDEKICFPPAIKNSITSQRINLVDVESYKIIGEKKFDIVFLRNVFIYFSLEQRYKILNNIAKNYLKDDGYIFVSLSETAQLEEKNLQFNLEKICINNVFVFHKKTPKAEVNHD